MITYEFHIRLLSIFTATARLERNDWRSNPIARDFSPCLRSKKKEKKTPNHRSNQEFVNTIFDLDFGIWNLASLCSAIPRVELNPTHAQIERCDRRSQSLRVVL